MASSVNNHTIKPIQEDKSRCWECSKKLLLSDLECRCGYLFCMNHRYPEKHNCTYDYKATGRNQLQKELPVVKADKLKSRIT